MNFVYVAGSIEKIPTKHFTYVPQIIGITQYMQQFFADNNFQVSKSDIKFDQDSWNMYTQHLKKYNRKNKYNKFIGFIARIIATVGITKYGRQTIREYIKHILHAN